MDHHQIYWPTPTVKFEDKLCYVTEMEAEKEMCPADPRHTRRERWKRPLKTIGTVTPLTDFEWTVMGDLLVSPNIVSDFQNAGFSGVEFHPVEIFTTTETPIGRETFELRITGWGGYAPPSSGIRVLEECSHCGRRIYSGFTNKERLFDPKQWDGSDLFIIWPMPRKAFVTLKVRDFIMEHGYTGVNMKPLHELKHAVAGTFTPGNLRDWFDNSKLANILERY